MFASLGARTAVPLPLALPLSGAPIVSRCNAPLEHIVVLDAFALRQSLEQLSEPLVVREVAKVEATDVGVEDFELRREADGQELLAFELLVPDEVPGGRGVRAFQFPPRQAPSHEVDEHICE